MVDPQRPCYGFPMSTALPHDTLKPVGAFVFVRKPKPPPPSTLLWVPDGTREAMVDPNTAEVVAVGPDVKEVRVGDIVVMSPQEGYAWDTQGLAIHEKHIVGVVEP